MHYSFFSNGKDFWNNTYISNFLESKIQLVVLMAKFESLASINHELQRRETIRILTRQTITSMHQNFIEIDLFQNYIHTKGS